MRTIELQFLKIDVTTTATFEEIIKETEDQEIILDFSKILYISSIGLRSLMKLTKAGKKISIINANQTVIDIFKVTGLDKIYQIN